MKPYIGRGRYLFAQHISLLYFIIFGLLFFGYLLDFIIFKDWSFLYVTVLAPFLIGMVYTRKEKEKKTRK